MLPRTPDRNKHLAAAAEQQMRKWALGQEVHHRLEEADPGKSSVKLRQEIRPYVAISRETGSGGGEIANRLSRSLGWDILGRELLDDIAQRFRVSRPMLNAIDEPTPNWISELFGKWLDRQLVTPSQYLRQLGQVILRSARASNCIFIGRAAQFILPPARGLAVRLVAPLEDRIARIMQLRTCRREEAEAFVHETDRKRRAFIAHQFGRDIDDLHLYDLAFNLRHMDADTVAAMVAEEVQRRFPSLP